MPGLKQSLRGRDLGHLRIVAEHWGIDLEAPDARSALEHLVPVILDPALAQEIIESLPEQTRDVLADLVESEGRLPWAAFIRKYGDIREMGPGRRDRQRPDREPESPSETLWYRALIARAFFDTPEGPQEFAFLPDEFVSLIPSRGVEHKEPLGRPASPRERANPIPANDRILDHATTLLAALRLNRPALFHMEEKETEGKFLRQLLTSAGIISPDGEPLPDPTRLFLENSRGESLTLLVRVWLNGAELDELRSLPGLQAEGDWENDPGRTRRAVLGFLSSVPPNAWWSLTAFTAAIKDRHPDFQRSGGEYDSWYLRSSESGEYLRGFEHWDDIEGALIRYMITTAMHRLGILDLAAPDEESPPAAFRLSHLGAALLKGKVPEGLPAEDKPVHVRSDGRISVPRLAPRDVRYQIARFCAWEAEKPDEYRYRLTPSSLARAREGGLRVGHLLGLLSKHAGGIPPNVTKALKDWEASGAEARIERHAVLRLSSPEMLAALRNSRAGRFLGDLLGPTTVIVKPGAEERVQAALIELGVLGEILDENE